MVLSLFWGSRIRPHLAHYMYSILYSPKLWRHIEHSKKHKNKKHTIWNRFNKFKCKDTYIIDKVLHMLFFFTRLLLFLHFSKWHFTWTVALFTLASPFGPPPPSKIWEIKSMFNCSYSSPVPTPPLSLYPTLLPIVIKPRVSVEDSTVQLHAPS